MVGRTSFRVATSLDGRDSTGPSIQIQGVKGHIKIFGSVTTYSQALEGDIKTTQDVHMPVHDGARGMFWERDEVAHYMREEKFDSETLSWDESIITVEAMGQVRQQGGLVYPPSIDSTVYSLAV